MLDFTRWLLCLSFFFVWYVCLCMGICTYELVLVCMCTWRSKVDIGYLPGLPSVLYIEEAGCLFWGSISFSSQDGGLQAGCHANLAFLCVLESPVEPSPQSQMPFLIDVILFSSSDSCVTDHIN